MACRVSSVDPSVGPSTEMMPQLMWAIVIPLSETEPKRGEVERQRGQGLSYFHSTVRRVTVGRDPARLLKKGRGYAYRSLLIQAAG
jgi:hypothetical protein